MVEAVFGVSLGKGMGIAQGERKLDEETGYEDVAFRLNVLAANMCDHQK